MRRFTTRAAAVIAATLVLAGCASADDGQPSGPEGPNGYELAATFDEGSTLWWDRSTESGLTDLIVEDPSGRIAHSCLGTGPQYCWDSFSEPTTLLVIAPPEAERATLTWYGNPFELERGEISGPEAPPVFGFVLPEYTGTEDGWRLEVFDGAGAVVMTQ